MLGPVGELSEEEGVRERAAADGDGGAAGLAKHRLGVGDRADVAVADDRQAVDGLDHPADPLAVDRAAEPLARVRPWTMTAATPIDSNSRASSGAVGFILSQPSRIFTVTGTGECSTTAPTSRLAPSPSHISAEPPPVLDDLADGASHVDVDDRCAEVGDDLRRLDHLPGGGAVNLDRRGAVLVAGCGQVERLGTALDQGSAVDQVGRRQAEAAQLADGQPIRQRRVAGQRREEEAARDRHRPDLQRLPRDRRRGRQFGLGAVVGRESRRGDRGHVAGPPSAGVRRRCGGRIRILLGRRRIASGHR